MFKTKAEIEVSLRGAGLGDVAGQIADMARAFVQLTSKPASGDDEIPVGSSKLGGCPDLPDGWDWPIRPPYADGPVSSLNWVKHLEREEHLLTLRIGRRREFVAERGINPTTDRFLHNWLEELDATRADLVKACSIAQISQGPIPLPFIAQVNLDEVSQCGFSDPAFPRAGLLLFFYDIWEESWGSSLEDAPGIRLIWTDATSTLSRRAVPDVLHTHDLWLSPCSWNCSLQLSPPLGWTEPPCNGTGSALARAVEGHINSLIETSGNENWANHRLGGWSVPIQDVMEPEC